MDASQLYELETKTRSFHTDPLMPAWHETAVLLAMGKLETRDDACRGLAKRLSN